MAETAPLMLLEATLVHVRMELEGKTAKKVSLEKPSLRTFQDVSGLFAEEGVGFWVEWSPIKPQPGSLCHFYSHLACFVYGL